MIKMLAKVGMERILELEGEEPLGEKKNAQRRLRNSKNTSKTLKTDNAEIDFYSFPRSSLGTFSQITGGLCRYGIGGPAMNRFAIE